MSRINVSDLRRGTGEEKPSRLALAKREAILDLEDWAIILGRTPGQEEFAMAILKASNSIRTGLAGLAVTQLAALASELNAAGFSAPADVMKSAMASLAKEIVGSDGHR